jgi:hypothetical protein
MKLIALHLRFRQRNLRAIQVLAQQEGARPGWSMAPAHAGNCLRDRSAPLYNRPQPVTVQRRHAVDARRLQLRAGGEINKRYEARR